MTRLIECPQCYAPISELTAVCICGFNILCSPVKPHRLESCLWCNAPADITVGPHQFLCDKHYRIKTAPKDYVGENWTIEDCIAETKRLLNNNTQMSK